MPPHVHDKWADYLGPGALTSLVLAMVSTVLTLGLPVFYRLREVLRQAAIDEREASDVVLIFGRVLQEDHPSEVFRARLDHGATLLRDGLASRIIVTGGMTGNATRSEAEAGRDYLLDLGLPEEALLTEDQSKHSLENLFNARETLREKNWSKLILVSDPLHMARVSALAQGLALDFRCSPAVDSPPRKASFGWWTRALREAFFVHWYHTGMLYSRTIRSKRLLSRVT